jgi:2-C-methyl-D-erythritol 4-phosphate cytidylyltransferase
MAERFAAIVCAAGKSIRFGGARKKPFVEVGARAAFLRSVELFTGRDDIKQILVAIRPEDEELVRMNWGAALSFHGAKLCFGGEHRFETVAKALELVKAQIDLVIVHDAVRCCVTKEWLDEVLQVAVSSGAAVLACPVAATLKRVQDKSIVETVQRTGLYEAQTPQVFRAELLRRAYANLRNLKLDTISDDSQLVEALGEKVAIVQTDSSNIKITTRSDVAIAEAILKSRPRPEPKGPMGPYEEAQW